MITLIKAGLLLLIVALLIYRIFKYKFKKYNTENVGLFIIGGLFLMTENLPTFWRNVLIILDIVLLLALIVTSALKDRKQS